MRQTTSLHRRYSIGEKQHSGKCNPDEARKNGPGQGTLDWAELVLLEKDQVVWDVAKQTGPMRTDRQGWAARHAPQYFTAAANFHFANKISWKKNLP